MAANGLTSADELMRQGLYWWDIATFYRCAIERDPSNCDIALVGVPHSTGNGTTRDYPHRGMLARRGFSELGAHDADLAPPRRSGTGPGARTRDSLRSRSG